MSEAMSAKSSIFPVSSRFSRSTRLPQRDSAGQLPGARRVLMTNKLDDNALVQGCLGGDEHAFEILVVRYQGPIYNAVLRMVRDRDDASDLTQNAFLKAYQQLARFDPQYKFFSWLYRIAINESLNFV